MSSNITYLWLLITIGAILFIWAKQAASKSGRTIPDLLTGWISREGRSRPTPPSPPAAEIPVPAQSPIRFGNIPPIETEEDDPDLSQTFVFAERQPPTIQYENFNRRLIIFTVDDAVSNLSLIGQTVINDEPLRCSGPVGFLHEVARTKFRPAHPTVIDFTSAFARTSERLERDPLHINGLVRAVVGKPENDRPVVISVSNPAACDARREFVFMRYGFEDFRFDPAFMGDVWHEAFPMIFEKFTGSASDWMYFSRARLCHMLTETKQAITALERKLREDAEQARQWADELENDESFDAFADLWKGPAAEKALSPKKTQAAAE